VQHLPRWRAARLACGMAVASASAAIALTIPATHSVLRYSVLDVALLVFAAIAGDAVAAVVAGLAGYALFQGFVVHPFGDLTGHGAVDVWRFTGVVLAVGVGIFLGGAVRLIRRTQ
jgi:hypothetical protein